MEELISNIGPVVSGVLSWTGSVVSTIVSTPLLLLATALTFVGTAIGIFKGLFSR